MRAGRGDEALPLPSFLVEGAIRARTKEEGYFGRLPSQNAVRGRPPLTLVIGGWGVSPCGSPDREIGFVSFVRAMRSCPWA